LGTVARLGGGGSIENGIDEGADVCAVECARAVHVCARDVVRIGVGADEDVCEDDDVVGVYVTVVVEVAAGAGRVEIEDIR